MNVNTIINGLIVAVILGGVVWRLLYGRQQGKKVRAWAEKQGYSYQNDRLDWHNEFREIQPFGKGHSNKSFHGIEKEGEAVLRAFEYHYTTGSGKNSNRHIYTISYMEMPSTLHALSIKPEHLGHKLLDAMGGEDIDFESDEFSRKYWVKCADRKYAYDVIDARMMEHLLQQSVHLQWIRKRLVAIQKGHMQPAKVRSLWTALQGFRDNVPERVLSGASVLQTNSSS